MRLVEYKPEHFDLVRRAAERMGAQSLRHRPFVDHYYATREGCRLYMALDDDGEISATVGVDQMRFEYESRPLLMGFGTNFHSLQPGSGGYLFMQWIKSCEVGMVFGGTADTHRILTQQKWTYFQGVKTYFLNPRYAVEPGEPAWRIVAKWGLRNFARKTDIGRRAPEISREAESNVFVQEESDYSENLLPRCSPFTFRFAPTLDYLRWRYDTRLSFVRYRLFCILEAGNPAGYVILNDAPERLIVAQCDANSPTTLAYGVLLSLAEVFREARRPREVLLTACHPQMQALYRRHGFVTRDRWDRPFALGLRRSKIEMSPDTSNWLINYDWGDNGLRAPFLDQRR